MPMDTSSAIRHRFDVEIHVESSSRVHRFRKANPRGNYDIDSMKIFRSGFDFRNR